MVFITTPFKSNIRNPLSLGILFWSVEISTLGKNVVSGTYFIPLAFLAIFNNLTQSILSTPGTKYLKSMYLLIFV